MTTKTIEKPTLGTLFQSFQTGLRAPKSEEPRQYLEELGLNYNDLEIGFNSGQFHHRKDEEFKKPYVALGVLKESNANVRDEGTTPYTMFGAYGIVFPLKDENGEIVNYYATRIKLASKPSAYLNNKGLYPCYPHELTKKLYIAQSVEDAAFILQYKICDSREAVIALHDGEMLPQHFEAIKGLRELEEIKILKK